MLHRIRLAMQQGTFDDDGRGGGEVEADETFIGGQARNMHKHKRAQKITGTGGAGKAVVMGLLDRETGKVRVAHVRDRKRETVAGARAGSTSSRRRRCYTDELVSYTGLDNEYVHEFINHAESYVKGNVHTNGMENFWSLLKRGLQGHLRQRRAVPSVPLLRRAGVPLQRAQERRRRRGPLRRDAPRSHRQPRHLQAADRQGRAHSTAATV